MIGVEFLLEFKALLEKHKVETILATSEEDGVLITIYSDENSIDFMNDITVDNLEEIIRYMKGCNKGGR